MQEWQTVGLENIGNGAAVEMFNNELKNLVENVIDPNTEHKKTRKITLEVCVKVSEDRKTVMGEIRVKKQLAGKKTFPVVAFIGEENGEPIMIESKYSEELLPFGNVVNLGGK